MSNVTRKLILEDGTTFVGEAFGGSSDKAGEVIFYPGMTGYQEMLTDPSCCQHIVVMTIQRLERTELIARTHNLSHRR